MKVELIRGDITKLDVDAVVNAANSALAGGGGVDGAIHRAAGPELDEACAALGGCVTGDAKATPGFRMKAKWIFHAVGPVWKDGSRGEDECLRRCYERCMDLSTAHGVDSIAFPAISTGIYGFPKQRAAEIAVKTVGEHGRRSGVKRVVFCCFDAETESIYRKLLDGGAQVAEERPATSRPGGSGTGA